MEKRDLQEGDLLQLNPHHENFGGMLIVVTEPKSWGCQGYLMASRNFEATRYKGRAYLRAKFEEMEYIGRLEWFEYIKEEDESCLESTN